MRAAIGSTTTDGNIMETSSEAVRHAGLRLLRLRRIVSVAALAAVSVTTTWLWADGVDPLDTALQQVSAVKAKVKSLGIAIIGIGVIVSIISGAWHLLIERSRQAIVMTIVGLVVATIGIAIISSQ